MRSWSNKNRNSASAYLLGQNNIITIGKNIDIEIDPRLELLTAVQLWTTWARPGQFGDIGERATPYMTKLKKFMKRFQKSDAVRISEFLLNSGFSFDAPPNLILSTRNGLAFDPPAEGYSSYLVERGQGETNLDDFLEALRKLAAKSRFDKFFEAHRGYYRQMTDRQAAFMKAERNSQWLHGWFGGSRERRFHCIFSPAMMPGGVYGATIVRREQGTDVTHIYQIIRDAERCAPAYLNSLTLHEFGHSFVNPAIGDQVEKLRAATRRTLGKIFEPVRSRMEKMAYPELETFLNEAVVRAATIRALFSLGDIDEAGVEKKLQAEADRGFYCIDAVYLLLVEYESNRDKWPDFISYGPELLERLAANTDQLIPDS